MTPEWVFAGPLVPSFLRSGNSRNRLGENVIVGAEQDTFVIFSLFFCIFFSLESVRFVAATGILIHVFLSRG